MSGPEQMFGQHAAEIEKARQDAEAAAREHDAARDNLEALEAEYQATDDALGALAPSMNTAQLGGDDAAISSLRATFQQLTERRNRLAVEISEAQERLDVATAPHVAYGRATNVANSAMTAAARERDQAKSEIDRAFDARVNKPWRSLLAESAHSREDMRELQRSSTRGEG